MNMLTKMTFVPLFFFKSLNLLLFKCYTLFLSVIFVKLYKIPLNFKITPGPIMNFWVFKSLYTVNVCLAMKYCN